MDAFQATLGAFDPQSIPAEDLNLLLPQLEKLILKTKATQALQPALVAESRDFRHFSRLSLQRLQSLIEHVFADIPAADAPGDAAAIGKVSRLCELDAISFVIFALSISKKALDRMEKKLFDEMIRQTQEASYRLLPLIMASNEIADTIRHSQGDTFKSMFDHFSEARIGAHSSEFSVRFRGIRSWCYSKPTNSKKFHQLVAMAVGGALSTYIAPLGQEYGDCLIKAALFFDIKLLKTLFGIEYSEYTEEHAHIPLALKSGIAPVFGDEVFRAVQTTYLWTQEDARNPHTACVSADIFAGHTIIVNLTIQRDECISFVNIAYKL